MGDAYRKKFPKGSDWKESDGNNHGAEIIGMDIRKYKRAIITITKIERELKDAWERNEVQNKYWHNIATERNTLKESQPKLLKHIMSIEKVNAELKEKVKELETELYFCNRNKRVEDIVDGS